MYYELHDSESQESMEIVHVTNPDDFPKQDNFFEEVSESWTDYNQLQEHELDPFDVDQFIEWHNAQWDSQLERIYVEFIQPTMGDPA